MAAWKPVFALAKWWLLETIIAWETWEFFYEKSWKDFIERFNIFDKNNKSWKYLKENCQKQAEKFSEEKFNQKLKNIISWQ